MLRTLLISRHGNGAVYVAEMWSVPGRPAAARHAVTPAGIYAASATARAKHTTRYWRPVIVQVKYYLVLQERQK